MKHFFSLAVLFALVATASATPIHPDIKKLLSTPRPTMQFAPARVGWNGPEASSSTPQQSPVMERYGPQAFNRNLRSTLLEVVTPDWRILLGLGVLIVLLRALRTRSAPAVARAPIMFPVDAGERQRPAA